MRDLRSTWFVSGIFLALLCVSTFFCVKSFSGLYDKQIPTYTGTMVSKYTEEFACGKHDRQTCHNYYVETTDKYFRVDPNTYNRATPLFPFTVYKTVSERPWYATLFIWLWIPALLGFCMTGPEREEEE